MPKVFKLHNELASPAAASAGENSRCALFYKEIPRWCRKVGGYSVVKTYSLMGILSEGPPRTELHLPQQ
jgi:hypothetical protein